MKNTVKCLNSLLLETWIHIPALTVNDLSVHVIPDKIFVFVMFYLLILNLYELVFFFGTQRRYFEQISCTVLGSNMRASKWWSEFWVNCSVIQRIRIFQLTHCCFCVSFVVVRAQVNACNPLQEEQASQGSIYCVAWSPCGQLAGHRLQRQCVKVLPLQPWNLQRLQVICKQIFMIMKLVSWIQTLQLFLSSLASFKI